MRPPQESLLIPRSFGCNGGFGMIPILALTKLAAVRQRNCFPFLSAYGDNKLKLVKYIIFLKKKGTRFAEV